MRALCGASDSSAVVIGRMAQADQRRSQAGVAPGRRTADQPRQTDEPGLLDRPGRRPERRRSGPGPERRLPRRPPRPTRTAPPPVRFPCAVVVGGFLKVLGLRDWPSLVVANE